MPLLSSAGKATCITIAFISPSSFNGRLSRGSRPRRIIQIVAFELKQLPRVFGSRQFDQYHYCLQKTTAQNQLVTDLLLLAAPLINILLSISALPVLS